ncbi:MAG TPA: TIGR03618 family F420-dependent PPOX class oxidoreductase [Actinomycetota bacterium]|nr:TIGR03618 family F420-dependent PPOX class oxidoreductase [Actinomycetota bacterium]
MAEPMDPQVTTFLEKHHGTIQSTLKKDGTPHLVRISVGLVDGKLWSSATQTRVRTKHLRRDPRSTLFVLGDDPWHWLGLETKVTILDGPDAVDQNLALYRVIAGKDPDDMEEYRRAMVDDQRIIYEFEILRTYGQF